MITLLILIAGYILGSIVVRWANKPSKRNPRPLPPGKPVKMDIVPPIILPPSSF